MDKTSFFAGLGTLILEQMEIAARVKEFIVDTNFEDLAQDMKAHDVALMQHQLNLLHEAMERNKAEVGKNYDFIRRVLMPQKMEDEGLSSANYEGVGRVSLKSDIFCHVNDQIALIAWLEENNLDSVVKETVNSSSLKAILRSRLQEGKEVPGEKVIHMSPYTMAVITPTKKTGN